jgi:hypothetical protein
MERIITELPDKWVVLKLSDNSLKVFATWYGGFSDGDRWKLNSGVQKIEQDDDFYYFIGFSGSCYKCNKNSYGVATSYGLAVLDEIIKSSAHQIKILQNFD